MRLLGVLSWLVLAGLVAAAPRKRRHVASEEEAAHLEAHHHQSVSFFDSFFSFFSGGSSAEEEQTSPAPPFVRPSPPHTPSSSPPPPTRPPPPPPTPAPPPVRASTPPPRPTTLFYSTPPLPTPAPPLPTPAPPLAPRQEGLAPPQVQKPALPPLYPSSPLEASTTSAPPLVQTPVLPPLYTSTLAPALPPAFIRSQSQAASPPPRSSTTPSPLAVPNQPRPIRIPGLAEPLRPPAQAKPPARPPPAEPRFPGQPPPPRAPGQHLLTLHPSAPPPQDLVPLASPLAEESCNTRSGEVGQCASAYQCGAHGGRLGDFCPQGADLAPRACCVFSEGRCGAQTSHRVSYFARSRGSSKPSSCGYRVNLLPRVCQVRLDFLDLQLGAMEGGACHPDNRLVISVGPDQVARIPVSSLCGVVGVEGEEAPLSTDLPHLYIHLDRDSSNSLRGGEAHFVQLDLKVLGAPASWNIRVTQITCDGAPLQAPAGCDQYHTGLTGRLASLNLRDGQYLAGLDITSCIARDRTACAVEYTLDTMQVGPTRGGGLGFGLACSSYLAILGERTAICGGSSAGRALTLPVTGPLALTLRSQATHSPGKDRGFAIRYRLLDNCRNVTYFEYPGTRA